MLFIFVSYTYMPQHIVLLYFAKFLLHVISQIWVRPTAT